MNKKAFVIGLSVVVVLAAVFVAFTYVNDTDTYTEADSEKSVLTLNAVEGIDHYLVSKNGGASWETYTGPMEFPSTMDNIVLWAVMDPDYTFVQWADGLTDNPYYIGKLLGDVTFTPVVATNCTVTPASDGTGYTIEAISISTTVNYRGDYQFKVILSEGYDLCADDVYAMYSGTCSNILYSVSGNEVAVTVSSITSDGAITIGGVVINTYSVTLPSGTGYTAAAYGGSFSPVNYMGSYSFTVTLEDAYDMSSITVYANGVELSSSGGVYTISDITEDQVMTVEGVTINTYSVSGTLTVVGGSASGVEVIFNSPIGPHTATTISGGSFTIEGVHYGSDGTIIAFIPGFIQTVSVSIESVESDLYDQDITLEITTYSIISSSGTGYTVEAYGGSSSPVDYMGSYSFTVNLEDAYDMSSFTVYVNFVELSSVGGVYTITDITEDQTIIVDGVTINTYSVTLPSGTGYSAEAYCESTSPVDYGGNFCFIVNIDLGYGASSMIVKINGSVIEADAGVYTITDITANQVVTVEGVEVAQYSVSETEEHATINITSGVTGGYAEYGTDITLTAAADSGYMDLVVGYYIGTGGYTIVSPVSGVYTIPGDEILGDVIIVASAYAVPTYTVTLTSGDGYYYYCTESLIVPQGGDLSFSVLLEEAYDESVITVKTNGTTLTAVGGVYTITDITSDQTVTVEGVELNTCTVTPAESGTGYTIEAVTPSPVIVCGTDYVFNVILDEGYSHCLCSIVVTYSGEHDSIIKTASGDTLTVTIPNVNTDGYVTVSGISIDTYSISIPTGLGYIIKPESGSVSPVYAGASYSFTVTLSEGFEPSYMIVWANETALTAVGGVYTITNIYEDQVIFVELNVYNVSGTLTVIGGASAEGVVITLMTPTGSYDTVTLSDGSYTITGVPYGSYGTVVVMMTGYTEVYEPMVEFLEADVTGVDITMELDSRTVTLVTGNGISGFLISGDGINYVTYTGTVSVGYGEYLYVKAISRVGYTFQTWDNGVTDNPYVIVDLEEDVTATAIGQLVYRTVTISDNNTMTAVVAGVSSGAAVYGTSIVFTVTPEPGYTNLIVGYRIGSGSFTELTAVDGLYTISGARILGNVTIISNAYLDGSATYNVTISSGDGYSSVCETCPTVAEDGSVTFGVLILDGYELTGISVSNGTVTSTAEGYVLSGITGDSHITVTVSGIQEDTCNIVPIVIVLLVLILAVAIMLYAAWRHDRKDENE